jgi:hypothetical protein
MGCLRKRLSPGRQPTVVEKGEMKYTFCAVKMAWNVYFVSEKIRAVKGVRLPCVKFERYEYF